MSNKCILYAVLFCLLMAGIRAQMSFVLNNYTVSPNYAKSLSSAYTFSFTAYNPSVGNIKLAAIFPNNFILTTATGCQIKLDSTLIPGTTCTFDNTINQISINNITISTTFLTIEIKFTTATSRYSGTSTIQFDFINSTSSSVITINRELVQIANAQMPCTLTSNSTVVGAPSVYTVQFSPTVIIEAGSVIQLQFDSWGPYSRSNFLTTSTTSVCSGQCTLSLLTSFQVELVIFSSLFPSSSNSSTTMTLNSVRNPSSFYPLNLKILVLASDGSSVYMVGNTKLTASTTNTFNGIVFDLPNKNISATNGNINLRITPRQPINWNTYLRIIYSSQYVSLAYTFGFSSLSTVPSQINGQPSGQMLINNLTRTTITSQPTLLSMGNFTLINPPFAQKPISITFRTQQLINNTLYFMDQSTIQLTGTASTITQSGIKPQVTTIGSVTTYDLWFVTVNKLISGSYVNITFPAQTHLNLSSSSPSTCVLNNGILSTCTVMSASLIKVTLLQVVNAGTNLTFTITRVTNPLLTAPSSSFLINTYYMDDQSVVDQLSSGLVITATQITMKSVVFTSSSNIVNAKATYTFNIQPTYTLPTATVIKITFPSQLTEGGQNLQSLSIDGTTISGCQLSSVNNSQLTLSSNCIPSQISNTSTISIKINNITNPTSFKPTESFLIQAFNGIYRQQYLGNGIIVTMNQTTSISSFKITPNSFIANDSTLYIFDVVFQIKRYSGDRVLIKLPTDVILSSTFDCGSLTTDMTISCSKYDSTTIAFVLNFANGGLSGQQQSIKFTLSNLTNMWYATTRTFTLQSTTNDTIFYYQEQGSFVVNYQPATLTSTINNDNNIILLGQSKIILTLTSPYKLDRVNNIYSQFYILVQVPSQLTPVNNSCVLSNGSSVCQLASAQVFNVTSIGDISSALTLTFNAQTAFFETSSTFDIKLYYSTNLVQSNNLIAAKRFCQLPCKQCISTNSVCLSCLPSPYVTETIYFSFNNTCVNQCPDTYFLNSTDKSCGRCSSTCLNCINSASQCISCPVGKYLLNKTCLSLCPNGYYSLNNECLLCSSPCATCSGQATSCLTCINGYFIDNGSSNNTKCVTSCSNSNYLGMDGQCRQCTNNCKTCSVSLTNCTSCDETIYRFYQNSCVRNCPVGMYTSAIGTCSNCVSPCLTCTTQLNCQSCVNGYYLYNGTTCVTQCPNGFIQLVSQCITCDSKCATCEVTVTNCTSCPSGSYFYQNNCFTTCPALTYPYNRTCTKCITPCVTCSSSPELCLSCIDGLLLLNNTCVSQCPLSGYIQQQTQCTKCPQNCLSCSTSINCTLCNNQFYLLQGACTSTCPVNYPIVSNRQCEQCADVCLTCSTSKDNCTSCKIGYFKHLYTCVQVCPLGYYSNVMTYECEDGLSTKIVFFPLLILTVIISAFVIVAKLLTLQTSLPPSLVSLLSLTQLAIWIYMLVQLSQPIKQLNVDYALPIAMNVIALVALLGQNIGFFYLELKRMQQDEYVKGWATNNVNYTVLTIHRYVGLVINFKFFRFCYSRFFNIRSLSLPFKKNQNIFPLTTTFSILNFVLCQVPMLVCGFSLVYKKILKDQLFYTSIQCLVITIGCAIILLIDIFKSEDYFEESDYVKTRKYLEKIKDASFNQLQDNFDISKDEGSIDAEKFVSKTGGKFIFSKQDPSSIKELFFQQEDGSAMTEALQTIQTKNEGKSQHSPRKSQKRINIFDPIKEQDEQIYDDLKYSESQIKTQAQIEEEKQQQMIRHKQQDDALKYEDQRTQRLMQFGINTDDCNWDDTKSMIEQRPLKQKWNNIISHRQRLARSIFNTMDEYSTKELQKIIEPIQEDDYEEDDRQQAKQDPFRLTEYGKGKKTKRRRRKVPNQQQPGNSQLEKIYLQRLTEKKSHKNIFASSQSVKYDF